MSEFSWTTRLAKKIREIEASGAPSVVVLEGAGVSVEAGIPDFRSPGGMYDTLRPELLTATEEQKAHMKHNPTLVVSWVLFKNTSLPYLEVRRPFILGTAERKWKPTISHFFLRLLHDHGVLRRVLTQNIDGLDMHVGLPAEKIIAVHGSIALVACEFCGARCDPEAFRQMVREQIKDIYGVDPSAPLASTMPICLACNSPGLKPATVLYGRSLPEAFFDATTTDLPETQLLFVAGSSLTVYPAAEVPNQVPKDCMRVLVNLDAVGPFRIPSPTDRESRDIFAQGTCDTSYLQLIQELGWVEELSAFSSEMCENSQKILAQHLAGLTAPAP